MAKIIIEINDIEGGKVSVKSSPNFETMTKMMVSGDQLTAAHGYAFSALKHLWKTAKNQSSIIKAEIPKIGW